MAGTSTNPQTEPFPPLETAPPIPDSLSTASSAPTIHVFSDTSNLLRHSSSKNSNSTPAELSPRSGKPVSPGAAALQLTGQAAMADLKRRNKQKAAEDARQTSPNPGVQAMQSLMGGGGQSRSSDAPAPDKLSEPLRVAAERITVPTINAEEPLQASPTSMNSYGTVEGTGSNAALTVTAGKAPNSDANKFVAEPMQIDGGSYPGSNGHLAVSSDDGNKAFSYPGPSQQDQAQDGPSRGMSLPGYGQNSPKSPALNSSKRHKCPYCATDFTRHHNLKSHLLTHSQEKPYVCHTCQARFRRLHDLKRHTKLHTGERPHTCDKCGRRFARGDALARHNKGPGGCAGRRSSFPGDDEFGDGDGPDGMEGGDYGGGGDDDEGADQNNRRGSEPSRKRAHHETQHDSNREVYRQHSSTYPPPAQSQGRPHGSSVSSMGPPQVSLHPGSGTVTSPREMSGYPSPAAGSSMSSVHYTNPGQVLSQSNMIESPKPLSPGQPPDQHRLSVGDASMSSLRNRSPSLTTQFQQQHFGRGSGGRTPPQPHSQLTSGPGAPHIPVLPPLHQPNQLQTRLGMPPLSGTHGPSTLHHQQMAPASGQGSGNGSNPGSLSSHGRSSGSSRDMATQEPAELWNYVRALELRFSRMQDEYELRISRLQEELISLKGQVSNQASYSSEMSQRY